MQVTVTLLNDGIVGEPEEDIVLTLSQDLALSPLEDFRVLIHPTIRIAFSDNDGMYHKVQYYFVYLTVTIIRVRDFADPHI